MPVCALGPKPLGQECAHNDRVYFIQIFIYTTTYGHTYYLQLLSTYGHTKATYGHIQRYLRTYLPLITDVSTASFGYFYRYLRTFIPNTSTFGHILYIPFVCNISLLARRTRTKCSRQAKRGARR